MFKYEKDLVPDVTLANEWLLTSGETNQLYEVGNWSMELPEDGDMESAKSAIYAWIAWYDFLSANKAIANEQETDE